MPLIQNSPNKRFGLSRYWTQKRPMQNRETLFLIRRGSMQKWGALFLNQNKFVQNRETLFLIRRGSMQKWGALFLNQNKFVQNGENLFLIRGRFVRNGMNPFLIRELFMQNGGIHFLIRKRLSQNEGNVYGVEKWRLYLYWYPIWRTASSTADWSAVRWTKKTYSSACVSIKPSFKSCLLSAAS